MTKRRIQHEEQSPISGQVRNSGDFGQSPIQISSAINEDRNLKGIESMLPDEVQVPLPDYVRMIAREAGLVAAREVLEEHRKACPAATSADSVSKSIRSLEVRFSMLVGLMIGSGTLGGIIGVGVGAAVKALV